MPQPRVLDLGREESNSNLESFFNTVGSHYQKKQESAALEDIYKQYLETENEEKAFKEAAVRFQTDANIGPSKRLEGMDALKQIEYGINEKKKVINAQAKEIAAATEKKEEKQRKEAETYEILVNGGEDPKEAARLAKTLTPQSASARVKPVGKGGATPDDKLKGKLAENAAKEIPELEKVIAKGRDTLTNIADIRSIANNELKGPKGYVKAALNTESASKVSTLSATNLDTIIKLFNPAGTLPQAKLQWIRQAFAISPWDNASTIEGKLKTQEIITNQSIDRAQERKKLLRQYAGDIPEDVVKEFDKETGNIIDALKDELAPQEEKKKAPEGKVRVKDKKTGQSGSVTPYEGMESKYDIIK
jgi:hypothetical protein